MMKNAESHEAITAMARQAAWTAGRSLSQPKIHRPRNVDSTKNASSPSMASGAPKTSPTKREYSDQAIPNWNSWTRPVATPMMKLIRKSLPQNLVSRRSSGRRLRTHCRLNHTTTAPSPSVSGTIMKW